MHKSALASAIVASGLTALLMSAANVRAATIAEIVVTANRLEESIPQDLARYGNRVEVITAEEIQQMAFVDVTQTLQMLVPGLNIRPKNGPFDYFDASLQGSRNPDILWLIDGVRINNRLYNGTSPLDTVPAHMIERIEVLKGGQGIFYGTQSVGGVINVVTKALQRTADGAVGVSANSNNGFGLNGYYRAGSDRLQYAVYASQDEADGYQPWRESDVQPSATSRKRGYDVTMAGVKLGFRPTEDSLLSLHYQRTENELDFARPFLNHRTTNAREEDILTLKYDLHVNDTLELFVKAYSHQWETAYTRIYNRLDANGNVSGELNYLNNNDFWGYEDYGFNAMTKYSAGHGLEYIVGFDQQRFSGSDDVWRIAKLEERVNAGFFQIRTSEDLLDNTMLAVGARYNESSNAENKPVWNISGRHNLGDTLYVQANIGTSFRLPDAEQLFLNELYDDNNDGVPDDFFSIGNPDLKPEQSTNYNISLGGNHDRLAWELVGFKRKITDYIDSYVPWEIAGVEGESFINTSDEVEIDGVEVITALQLSPQWSLNFSHTRTRAELNGDGNQLPLIPESESKLRVNYQAQARPWGMAFTLNHVGDLTERQAQRRGNYAVMDISLHYALGERMQHNLALRVENLTDKVYATRVDRAINDVSGVGYLFDNLGMERSLHASYRYQF